MCIYMCIYVYIYSKTRVTSADKWIFGWIYYIFNLTSYNAGVVYLFKLASDSTSILTLGNFGVHL